MAHDMPHAHEIAARLEVEAGSPRVALASVSWAIRGALGKCRDFDFDEGVAAMVAARDLVDEAHRQWRAKSCFVCAGAGTSFRPCPECGVQTPNGPEAGQ